MATATSTSVFKLTWIEDHVLFIHHEFEKEELPLNLIGNGFEVKLLHLISVGRPDV